MLGLLPALPQREPVETFNRSKWDNVGADFHEDLGFKFTLVCRSIMFSFAGKKADSNALTKQSQQVSIL
jgi:hypothetical protein